MDPHHRQHVGGRGVDTLLFVLSAFYGSLTPELLAAVMISNYVFKCGIEALFTPVTYAVVNALKVAEHETISTGRPISALSGCAPHRESSIDGR